jgi:hypothetical protein
MRDHPDDAERINAGQYLQLLEKVKTLDEFAFVHEKICNISPF